MKKRIFLSDLIKEDGVTFDKNTLILAPSASGKTFFALNSFDENSLLITSEISKGHFIHLLNEFTDLPLKEDSVMSYDEFHLALKENEVFADKFTKIFCDEFQDSFEEENDLILSELFEDKDSQRKYYLSSKKSLSSELTEHIQNGYIQLLNYMDHEDYKG